VNVDAGRHTGPQAHRASLLGQLDLYPHADPAGGLVPVDDGVHQRGPVEIDVVHHPVQRDLLIGHDVGVLTDFDGRDLRFLEEGVDPYAVDIDDRRERLLGLDALAGRESNAR